MDPLKIIKHEVDGAWDNDDFYTEVNIKEHSIEIDIKHDTDLGEIVLTGINQPMPIKQEKCRSENGIDNQRLIKQKEENTYHCRHCDKHFSCESAVEHYRNMHSPHRHSEISYQCSKCKKFFADKSIFDSHQRTHVVERVRVEKQYRCGQCVMSCASKSGLKRHRRTHTGEKPYKCSHCEKCYAGKSNLIKHLMTHIGEKPFKCSICNMSFVDKISLVDHQRKHTVLGRSQINIAK
ncbi:unnamed protein product [Meganyctiphanes norvegica]|uniref:C2H2-type domain-containing protein n=1 Tax=Meganyctiphanes norvegica TaxID=48144 RepID=A0AAV2S786_MEGNR